MLRQIESQYPDIQFNWQTRSRKPAADRDVGRAAAPAAAARRGGRSCRGCRRRSSGAGRAAPRSARPALRRPASRFPRRSKARHLMNGSRFSSHWHPIIRERIPHRTSDPVATGSAQRAGRSAESRQLDRCRRDHRRAAAGGRGARAVCRTCSPSVAAEVGAGHENRRVPGPIRHLLNRERVDCRRSSRSSPRWGRGDRCCSLACTSSASVTMAPAFILTFAAGAVWGLWKGSLLRLHRRGARRVGGLLPGRASWFVRV